MCETRRFRSFAGPRSSGKVRPKTDAAEGGLGFPVYFGKLLIQFLRVDCVNLFRECNQTGNVPPHAHYG